MDAPRRKESNAILAPTLYTSLLTEIQQFKQQVTIFRPFLIGKLKRLQNKIQPSSFCLQITRRTNIFSSVSFMGLKLHLTHMYVIWNQNHDGLQTKAYE